MVMELWVGSVLPFFFLGVGVGILLLQVNKAVTPTPLSIPQAPFALKKKKPAYLFNSHVLGLIWVQSRESKLALRPRSTQIQQRVTGGRGV